MLKPSQPVHGLRMTKDKQDLKSESQVSLGMFDSPMDDDDSWVSNYQFDMKEKTATQKNKPNKYSQRADLQEDQPSIFGDIKHAKFRKTER